MGPTSKGSKDPNNRVLEPKYYNITGIWAGALKPYYLGPWTLRVKILHDLRAVKYHTSQGLRYLGQSRKIVVSIVGKFCEFWALFEKVLSGYI